MNENVTGRHTGIASNLSPIIDLTRITTTHKCGARLLAMAVLQVPKMSLHLASISDIHRIS